jgi:hypothetical protein
MRAGLRQPVGIGVSLLIGAAIGLSLAYSVWAIVALLGLAAAYLVLGRRR